MSGARCEEGSNSLCESYYIWSYIKKKLSDDQCIYFYGPCKTFVLFIPINFISMIIICFSLCQLYRVEY